LDTKRPSVKIAFPTTHCTNGTSNGSPKGILNHRISSNFDVNVTRDLEELIEELGKGDYPEQFQCGVGDDLLDLKSFIDDLTDEEKETNNKEKRKRL